MFKAIAIATLSAAALTIASSQPALAGGNGGAVAAGVVGGLVVGAVIGSQANRGYYGGPGYYDNGGYQPVYAGCRVEREQVVDQYGRYHTRRIQVCD
jgi:hypothetical protein